MSDKGNDPADFTDPSDEMVEAVANALTQAYLAVMHNTGWAPGRELLVYLSRFALAAMEPFVVSADEIKADIIEQVRRTNFDQTFNGALSETLIELFANPIPDGDTSEEGDVRGG